MGAEPTDIKVVVFPVGIVESLDARECEIGSHYPPVKSRVLAL